MSLLLGDVTPLPDLPLPRSWRGEGRPRLAAPPPAAPTVPRPRVPVGAQVPADAVDPHPAATRRALSRLGDGVLTLAAVLGLMVLGITVTAHVTGLRPLVVRSGSMEPTIPTGAMVLVRTVAASTVVVGDVVAVDRPDRTRVTHRVVEVTPQGVTTTLRLKGDANEDPDAQPLVVSEVGLLVASVPSIGRVSALLASPQGGFALGCLVTALALPVLRRGGSSS